jgi:CelD/BcsL family acetyltransferase involved in cellulose biosynthesis
VTKRLEIAEERPATAAGWDAVWAACPWSTYPQSRAWAEDWSAYTGGQMTPEPRLVRFSDGRRVVLPLTRQRRRSGPRYLLTPAGNYGGWLSGEPLASAHAELLVELLMQTFRPLWWRVNPFDPLAAVAARHASLSEVTYVLALDRADELQSGHRQHCQSVRKARRLGLRVRPAAAGAGEWHAYYDIYEAALQRWGDDASSCYGPELFELLRRREGVELWVVEAPDGTVISGAIALYARRHVALWHMATLAAHYRSRPTSLLIADLVRDAQRRGLEWFDLNPSGGHEGVVEFKERVGAEPLECPVIVAGPLPFAMAAGALQRVRRGTRTRPRRARDVTG